METSKGTKPSELWWIVLDSIWRARLHYQYHGGEYWKVFEEQAATLSGETSSPLKH